MAQLKVSLSSLGFNQTGIEVQKTFAHDTLALGAKRVRYPVEVVFGART